MKTKLRASITYQDGTTVNFPIPGTSKKKAYEELANTETGWTKILITKVNEDDWGIPKQEPETELQKQINEIMRVIS